MKFELAICPYCNYPACEADWVDVEVGYVQCGPYLCDNCGASQIGPFDTNPTTPEEDKMGWFAPGKLGNTVNTFKGKPVKADQAAVLYRSGLLDKK